MLLSIVWRQKKTINENRSLASNSSGYQCWHVGSSGPRESEAASEDVGHRALNTAVTPSGGQPFWALRAAPSALMILFLGAYPEDTDQALTACAKVLTTRLFTRTGSLVTRDRFNEAQNALRWDRRQLLQVTNIERQSWQQSKD